MSMSNLEEINSAAKLSKDLLKAAHTLNDQEARYLVDNYYAYQRARIRNDNQVRAMEASNEPHSIVAWLSEQNSELENNMKKVLHKYTMNHKFGAWPRSVVGVGPVICAGLLAHIDMNRVRSAGQIWRYAGLDPTSEWLGTEKASALVKKVIAEHKYDSKGEKGLPDVVLISCALLANRRADTLRPLATTDDGIITQSSLIKALARRPWNATLKVITTFKLGESFVKVQNNENDYYGKIFRARKDQELANNLSGKYAEIAKKHLEMYNYGRDTNAYAAYIEGKLPDAHIHARARRFAVKIFLSHYFDTCWRILHGTEPPLPFVMAHMGHVHMIPPYSGKIPKDGVWMDA